MDSSMAERFPMWDWFRSTANSWWRFLHQDLAIDRMWLSRGWVPALLLVSIYAQQIGAIHKEIITELSPAPPSLDKNRTSGKIPRPNRSSAKVVVRSLSRRISQCGARRRLIGGSCSVSWALRRFASPQGVCLELKRMKMDEWFDLRGLMRQPLLAKFGQGWSIDKRKYILIWIQIQ